MQPQRQTQTTMNFLTEEIMCISLPEKNKSPHIFPRKILKIIIERSVFYNAVHLKNQELIKI
jgi:hypothetical protein